MPQKKHTELFGLYVHWPYCLSKCPYCDFASCVSSHIDEDSLITGYKRDIQKFQTSRPITSIFFGGGTPSLMSISFFNNLMELLRQSYIFAPDIEISLEANPDAITLKKMQDFAKAGVNRLSIGVQSLNTNDLKFLGRRHTLQRAIECIYEAKQVFKNINMDLIYARPHQSVESWQKELQKALSFDLPHYSLYQLTIEQGTVFFHKKQTTVSENQAKRLYLATDTIMDESGFIPYEISNYAKPGFECRHNMTYWLGQDYIGIGPAAHGRLNLTATENPKSITSWLKNGTTIEQLTPDQRHIERVLMGLRLKHHDFPIENIPQQNIQLAKKKGWIIQTNLGIRPTSQGVLMLNQLIQMLIQ